MDTADIGGQAMTTHVCRECGQEVKEPQLSVDTYYSTLRDLGEKNRITKWLKGVEKKHGLLEARFALADYMRND